MLWWDAVGWGQRSQMRADHLKWGKGNLSNKTLQYHFPTNIGHQKSNKNILTNKMDFSRAKGDWLHKQNPDWSGSLEVTLQCSQKCPIAP